MTSRKEKRRGARRCGSAQIELALVLLLLCLLLVVFIDFGRMLLVYNAVANAARAGVRYAMVNGNGQYTRPGLGPADNPPEVVAVIKNFVSSGMLRTSSFATSCTPSGDSRICVTYPGGTFNCSGALNAPGCPVDVTVVYRYDLLLNYFPLNVRLGSRSRGVITY